MSAGEAPSVARRPGRLLQVLGVGFGLAVTIGNTIASGIVRTPGEIAAQVPVAWVFISIWVAGGLYALLGANSLAELATMIPRSGGQFVFAHRALGSYAGFIVGWSDWISNCSTTAAVSIVIGEYTSVLIPALAGRAVLIAVFVAAGFALLQWRGVRWGSRTQEITALIKTLAFIVLVAACFALGRSHSPARAMHAPTGLALAGAVLLSLQAVIYTYDGWNGVVYFSEELREPRRDIVRSMFSGVVSITAIYLMLNAALVYVLPMREIAGQKFALGVVAQRVFGAHGDAIVRAVMVVSMSSSINAYHLITSRVLFAMSRDGLFTRFAAGVNPGGTPSVALFLSTAVAVAFILSGTFAQVIGVTAFFFVANYTVSFISIFVLRRKEPNAPRPFRTLGYPWTPAIALAGSIAFLAGAVAGDTRNSLWALGILAASYPAYRLLRRLAWSPSS